MNIVVTDNYEWFRNLSVSERFQGHELALKEHYIPFDESLTADGLPGEPDSGYIAMKRLLEKAIPPPFLLPTM